MHYSESDVHAVSISQLEFCVTELAGGQLYFLRGSLKALAHQSTSCTHIVLRVPVHIIILHVKPLHPVSLNY